MTGRKAQSTLEYLLVVSAVLVAIMLATGGFLEPQMRDMTFQAGETIRTAVTRVTAKLQL